MYANDNYNYNDNDNDHDNDKVVDQLRPEAHMQSPPPPQEVKLIVAALRLLCYYVTIHIHINIK